MHTYLCRQSGKRFAGINWASLAIQIVNFYRDKLAQLFLLHSASIAQPLPPIFPILFRRCATQRPVQCATSFENRRSLEGAIGATKWIPNKMNGRGHTERPFMGGNRKRELCFAKWVLAALWIMFRTVEVRTRFIDSRLARDTACCALRGPSTERGASGGLGSQHICTINLLNEPFPPNYSNADNNIFLVSYALKIISWILTFIEMK